MKQSNLSQDSSCRPRIGVSACVLGHEVRFDGGHKLDRYIRDIVGAFAEFVPVCPETEIGLGTPRETLRLIRRAGQEHALVAPKSMIDHSIEMKRYAVDKVEKLKALDLCGFIVKKDSPSCGMERVRVYPAQGFGAPNKDARGAFTAELMRAMPHLPVEEDGRLRDPLLRENFFERVFAYRRLRNFFEAPWRLRDLQEFHGREKLLLMAHADYRPLGTLVARGHTMDAMSLETQYKALFLEALSVKTSVGKHANVLQHIAGYFRKDLDESSRREVHDQIVAYHQRLLPLAVPLTLIRHHIRRLGLGYLHGQSYLWPHPPELMLRNHA